MSVPTNETLVNYLDRQLDAEAMQQVELQLQSDAEAAEAMEDLRFSVSLIREAGLQAQVAAARKEFEAGAIAAEERTAVIRPMFPRLMRVAAMVLLVAGAAAAYQYSSTSATGVFNENFSSYELNTNRGNNTATELENAFRKKDWAAVNSQYAVMTSKTQKTSFLAGMASLELKQYDNAISRFQEVLSLNAGSKESLYQDEAEYYLALAYLGAGKGKEGVALIKTIRANKDHLFYEQAGRIPGLDLKVLEMKGDK